MWSAITEAREDKADAEAADSMLAEPSGDTYVVCGVVPLEDGDG